MTAASVKKNENTKTNLDGKHKVENENDKLRSVEEDIKKVKDMQEAVRSIIVNVEDAMYTEYEKKSKKTRIEELALLRRCASEITETLEAAEVKLENVWRSYLKAEKKTLLVLFLLSLLLKIRKVSHPNSLVFDEVYLIQFSSNYLSRTYYVDLHPPIGKLVISKLLSLFGFEPTFEKRRIGNYYKSSSYVFVRMFFVVLGSLVVPMCYSTLRQYHIQKHAAIVGALFVLFESSFHTQFRYIMLDPILLFLTFLSFHYFSSYTMTNRKDSLVKCGIAMGLAAGTKMSGFLIFVGIGFCVLTKLVKDLKTKTLLKMAFLTAKDGVFLLLLPLAIWILGFWFHVSSFDKTSAELVESSSVFFRDYIEKMPATDKHVVYGSKITLRHQSVNGKLLASKNIFYNRGSKQQIVGTTHDEEDAWWVIEKIQDPQRGYHLLNMSVSDMTKEESNTCENKRSTFFREMFMVNSVQYAEGRPVYTGDVIRLRHVNTNRCIHSHDVEPPAHDKNYGLEVSCYGNRLFGDKNDYWIIEEVDINGKKLNEKKPVCARTMFLTFKHFEKEGILCTNKSLVHDNPVLHEVTCSKNLLRKTGIWAIEKNVVPETENSETSTYPRASFLYLFREELGKMLKLNKKVGLNSSHKYKSRPYHWVVPNKGIRMWSFFDQNNSNDMWKKSSKGKVHLLFNTATQLVTAFLVVYYTVSFVLSLAWTRKTHTTIAERRFLMFWYIHYVPYFFMKRVLYAHHYLAGYYFSMLLTACFVQRQRLFSLLLLPTIAVYGLYYVFSTGEEAGTIQNGLLRLNDPDGDADV